MKRIVHFKLLVLLVFFTGYQVKAQNQFLSFTDKKELKATETVEEIKPEREIIESDKNSTTVKYTISGGYVAEILAMDENEYEYIHVNGFGKMAEVGKPALPAHEDILATLGSKDPQVEIISSKFIEYDGYDIHPALPPVRDTEGEDEVKFVKDEKTYSTNAFYPKEIVEITEVLEYRGNYFSSVRVSPVQYNPVTKKIRVYSEITYKITYSDKKAAIRSSNIEQFKGAVINTEAIDDLEPTTKSSFNGQDPNYLIVAQSDYVEAAKGLAQWKSQLGYRTEIILKDKWTSGEVKNAVHSRYNSYNPKPTYLAIIGDHEQVPGQVLPRDRDGDKEYYATDLYYVCTGGSNDHFPDMAKGRISATNPEQAVMIVNKGINYEKNPVKDADFYKNGLNCAQFQDVENKEQPDGYACRRFCHTSEEVRDYVKSLGYDVTRVYQTDEDNDPKRFNNGNYSNGQKIPDELLRSSGFNWDGNANDIVREINEGKFYVLHRDHGYRGATGWAHPRFMTSDIKKLVNGNKQPIVFSMNCYTGEFKMGESFAEAFLRYEDGGAVGIVAASNYSLSGYNDGLTVGMFDAIWSDPGIRPKFGSGGRNNDLVVPGHESNIRTMGDVVNQGLIRMRENWIGNDNDKVYTHRLFHFFGDPALRIWTQKPEQITATYDKKLSCGATMLEISDISIDKGIATLVQGDELIASVNFTNNSVSLNFNSVDDRLPIFLTISAENNKPLVEEIRVTGCANLPKADFDVSDYTIVNKPGNPTVVSFLNQTTYSTTSFEWIITPSTFKYIEGTDATSENPVVVFNVDDIYTVSLKATNANGSHTETKKDLIKVGSIEAAGCKPVSYNLKSSKMCGIYHFKMNDLYKTSSGTVMDSNGEYKGYMDFTNKIATLKKNQKTDFEVLVGYRDEHFAMFIDYNNDGEFNNEEERILDYKNISREKRGSFNVLPYPQVDMVRMRIISDHEDFTISDACYSPRYGQVEDYTVRFVNVEPETEIGQLQSLSYTTASVNVGLKYDGGGESPEYGLVYTTDPAQEMSQWTKVSSSVNDKETTINLTSLSENTKYYVKSYGTNKVGTAYSSEVVEFTTLSNQAPANYLTQLKPEVVAGTTIQLSWEDAKDGILPDGYVIKWSTEGYDKIVAPQDGVVETEVESVAIVKYGVQKLTAKGLMPENTYFFKAFPYINKGADVKYKKDGTVPQMESTTLSLGTYATVSFGSPVDLVSVKFNTIENTTDRGKQGYVDFSQTHETTIERVKNYDITIEADPGSNDVYHCSVWFDWNQDNLFEYAEKTYIGSLKGKNTIVKSIAIPASAKKGETKMRILYSQKGTPSPYDPTKSEYGSAEDYKVIVKEMSGMWRGTYSDAWDDKRNWDDNKLPGTSTWVRIYGFATNYPVLKSKASLYGLTVNDGARLTIEEGADLSLKNNLKVMNGGQLDVNNGKTTVSGCLLAGSGASGKVTVKDGELIVKKDIYSAVGCSFDMTGGKVSIRDWKQSGSSIWSKGNIHFGGGEINVTNFRFSSSDCNVVMDGPIVVKIKGYFYNYADNWEVTDGTFIFHGNTSVIAASSSSRRNLKAYNVIVENTQMVYFNRKDSGKESGLIILGDFIVKGKASFVNQGRSCHFVKIEGNLIVEDGAELNLGDAEPAIKKNLMVKGKLIADDSEIKFHGSEEQEITCNQIIERLVVDNDAGGVKMTSDITINDKLILRGGSLKLNGHNFTILEDAYIEDADELNYPDAIITEKGGEVRKVMKTAEVKDFVVPFAYLGKYLPIVADISNVTTTGKYVSFSTINNADESVKENTSLNRCWIINTEEGFGDFKVDAKLTYLDQELGGLNETKLVPAMKNAVWESCGNVVASKNVLSVTTTQTGLISGLLRPTLDYSIDFVNETTNEVVESEVSYSVNSDFSGVKDGKGKVVDLAPGSKLYFRQLASESSLGTDHDFILDIPVRPAAPTMPLVNDKENTFGFILNDKYEDVSDYEVSLDNGANWSVVEKVPVNVGNLELEIGEVQVRISASNDKARFKSESLLSDERFGLTTNTIDVFSNKVSVYPNPSKGKVFVDLNGISVKKLKVVVFNASGQKVTSYNESNLINPEIDLTGYSKGLYYILLVSKKFNITEKVIIQ